MGKFLAKRLGYMLVTLWLAISITFFLMHAIPGGPFDREKAIPPELQAVLEARYKLDQPLLRQYGDYLANVARFELGPSFQRKGVTVNDIIKSGFPVTSRVGALSIVLIVLLGVPAGVMSALHANKWQDQSIRLLATVGVTIPSFILATLLIYVFSAKLNILPSFGVTSWKHFILPVATLGAYPLAFVTRLTRSSMLEVLQQDYIRTARAKGLPDFVVVYKHALKNALIPVATYLGPLVAGVMTGSFVVEKIFAIPGIGKIFVESVGNRDYTVLMGMTIFYAVFLLVMVLVTDLLYGILDPRIRIED